VVDSTPLYVGCRSRTSVDDGFGRVSVAVEHAVLALLVVVVTAVQCIGIGGASCCVVGILCRSTIRLKSGAEPRLIPADFDLDLAIITSVASTPLIRMSKHTEQIRTEIEQLRACLQLL